MAVVPTVRVAAPDSPGGYRVVNEADVSADDVLWSEGSKAPASDAASAPEAVNATDAAIELADEAGIDLAGVVGSGTGGRILKSDVEALVGGDG